MITGSFPPEITGGGIQCNSLLSALIHSRKYYVISTCKAAELSKREEKKWGILYRIYIKNVSILTMLFSLFKIIRIFLSIKDRINIVHLHGFSRKSIVFVVLAKLYKKKIVIKLTSLGEDDPVSIKKKQWGLVQYVFFSLADLYIGVSPAIIEAFKNSTLQNKRILHIPNGVDTEVFRPVSNTDEKNSLRIKLNLPINRKIMLTVGFISVEKGIDAIYNSLKTLKNKYRLFPFLLIIGPQDPSNGNASRNLLALIRKDAEKNLLENQIRLIDRVDNIAEYFRASDIFVFSSKREGLPNVLLEAMSCGLPVVAGQIRGITDFIIRNESDGLLFQLDNIDDMAEKISHIVYNESYSLTLGLNARKKITDRFSLLKIAGEYNKVYDKLVNS